MPTHRRRALELARPTLIADAETYTADEAAAKLGVCVDTVYRMVARGRFPVQAIRIGRRIRIPRAALDAALGDADG